VQRAALAEWCLDAQFCAEQPVLASKTAQLIRRETADDVVGDEAGTVSGLRYVRFLQPILGEYGALLHHPQPPAIPSPPPPATISHISLCMSVCDNKQLCDNEQTL
jgi:hypothetical protein